MRRQWREAGLALVAVLAAAGLARSLLVLHPPAAADLPEPLRRAGVRLPGQRSLREPIGPARLERDVAWGPAHRYRLEPRPAAAGGLPLRLELVARRSRRWEALPPPALPAQRLLRLGPRQQVALGRLHGRPALRTCLVGRGRQEPGPTAAVQKEDLSPAVARWRGRLDWPAERGQQLWRAVAIQAGLRVSERWECLQVTLQLEPPPAAIAPAQADAELLAAWRQLAPQLSSWGERWDGVAY